MKTSPATCNCSLTRSPSAPRDRVTVQVPVQVAEHLTSGQIQWMVPGLREELISVLLRALPKVKRRELIPVDQRAREIAVDFDPGRKEFLPALAAYLTQKYRVEINASDWPLQSVPQHLQPRVEVIDQKKNTVTSGRDLATIRASVQKTEVKSDAWDKAVKHVERYALSTWSFGDLPESIVAKA